MSQRRQPKHRHDGKQTLKTDQKMTEPEVFQLAEAGDLLGDYGYEDEADLVARICENEQIMLYTPTASLEQRKRTIMVLLVQIEEIARKLAAENRGNEDYLRALEDLIIRLADK